MIVDRLYKASVSSNGRWSSYGLVVVAMLLRFRYMFRRRQVKRAKARRPIRVLFLLSEAAKWKMQTVYEKMLATPQEYEPYVCPTIMDKGWIRDDLHAEILSRARDFFASKNVRMLDVCDENINPIPLRRFKPDIVIYQQPWGMAPCQAPIAVSRYALTVYSPYYVSVCVAPWLAYQAPFFKTIYAQFFENEAWMEYYRKQVSAFRQGAIWAAVGCPFRDEIAAVGPCSNPRKCIIYAPHWDFRMEGVATDSQGTFAETGKLILDYAKCHRDIMWIFKPHPVLKGKLIQRGLMTVEEVERYYADWASLGMVMQVGDYLSAFARSSAMITDGVTSFLPEYTMTDRPLVWINLHRIELLPPAKKLGDIVYQVHSLDELVQCLERVVVQGDDFFKASRKSALQEIGYDGGDVAQRFLDVLEKIVTTGKV